MVGVCAVFVAAAAVRIQLQRVEPEVFELRSDSIGLQALSPSLLLPLLLLLRLHSHQTESQKKHLQQCWRWTRGHHPTQK